MSLENIPIQVMSQGDALSGNARPLLMEVVDRVRHLAQSGETSAIDLSAMPLTQADKDWLKAQLGHGEISVNLEAEGTSTLEETACPGLWWITHRDAVGRVLVELLEITPVPDLVRAHPEDIKLGLEYLESVIYGLD